MVFQPVELEMNGKFFITKAKRTQIILKIGSKHLSHVIRNIQVSLFTVFRDKIQQKVVFTCCCHQ